jgi:hypothetical protein
VDLERNLDYPLTKTVTADVPSSRWIASLSNGETVFEDAIKGVAPAWERLALYVQKNRLAITKLRVQMGSLEVDLPSHQEGYIQKKRVMSAGGITAKKLCVGHVQGGAAVIHELGTDRSSYTIYVSDPGPPTTIYSHKEECNRSCCVRRD